jgi:hypothetical protein
VEPTIWHITVAVLALLGYMLVNCTLSTLAARVRQQRRRHDLIVESRRRRQEYVDSIADRLKHAGQ